MANQIDSSVKENTKANKEAAKTNKEAAKTNKEAAKINKEVAKVMSVGMHSLSIANLQTLKNLSVGQVATQRTTQDKAEGQENADFGEWESGVGNFFARWAARRREKGKNLPIGMDQMSQEKIDLIEGSFGLVPAVAGYVSSISKAIKDPPALQTVGAQASCCQNPPLFARSFAVQTVGAQATDGSPDPANDTTTYKPTSMVGKMFGSDDEDQENTMNAIVAATQIFANQLIDLHTSITNARIANEHRALDSWYTGEKNRLSMMKVDARTAAQMAAGLEEMRADKQSELSKKQAKIQAAQAITSALSSSAGMIMQFGAQAGIPGYAIGVALAATTMAIAIKNAAQIRGLAESYETGGIVPGSSYSGDNISANVNSGEMILNRQQQQELFAMANGKGKYNNSPIIHHSVVIQGNITDNQMNRLQEQENDFLQKLENGLEKLTSYGRINRSIIFA